MLPQEILRKMLELSVEQRPAFLDQACGDNQALRQQVEALLSAHEGVTIPLPKTIAGDVSPSTKPNDTALHDDVQHRLLAGRYKLLELLGEGGMGSVWLAEQREPVRRKVAIKLIKVGIDSKQSLARFEAERQALAMMDHPNIAKIFDGGVSDDGRPFIVMEFVQGVSLTQYCDQVRLPLDERLRLFADICHAVQHAHQKGVMHRDLKPSNLLVTIQDGKPVPKVIDFGLAKAIHQPLTERTLHTEAGMLLGTPLYMSPEQAASNNLDIDTRTDVYSLGVVLYELLTGTTPLQKDDFKQAAYAEILRMIVDVDPPKPSTRLSSGDSLVSMAALRSVDPVRLTRTLSGELDWIVMKALEKDRSRRFQSCDDFARDIECFLNGEVVSARPASAAYRIRKYVQRHRLLVGSASAIFALLCLTIAATTWGMFKANKLAGELRQLAEDRDRAATTAQKNASLFDMAAREAQQALNSIEANQAGSKVYFQMAMVRWEAGRKEDAINFLDQVPEQYRKLEWHLTNAQFHRDAKNIEPIKLKTEGGSTSKRCFDVSRSGKRLLTSAGDRGYRHALALWDANNGRLIWEKNGMPARANVDDTVVSAVISPDETRIVSADNSGTVLLWNADTGEPLKELITGTWPNIPAFSFSPDSTRVVVGGSAGELLVCQSVTGEDLFRIKPHSDWVGSVSFAPNGTTVYSFSLDGHLGCWQADSGNKAMWIDIFGSHSGSSPPWLIIHPDGTKAIVKRCGGEVACVDLTRSAVIWRQKQQTVGSMVGALSPDGRTLAVTDAGRIFIFDVATGMRRQKLGEQLMDDWCLLAFSPDSSRLVVSSRDMGVSLWDYGENEELRQLPIALTQPWRLLFVNNGSELVLAGEGGVQRWPLQTESKVTTLGRHRGIVMSASYSPDEKFVASASDEGVVKLWNVRDRQTVWSRQLPAQDPGLLAFSEDGQTIFIRTFEDNGFALQTETGELLPRVPETIDFSKAHTKTRDGHWELKRKLRSVVIHDLR